MQSRFEDIAKKKLVDDNTLQILLAHDSSKMEIEAIPPFLLIILINVIALFITVVTLPAQDVDDLPIWILFAVIGWGVIIYYMFTSRKTRCLIDKPSGLVKYFRGGILGTSFDESITNFEIKDITSIEMKRFVQRYGDTFQVRLLVGTQTSFELTRNDLKFSTCQAYAEIIRDFTNAALPIMAVD